MYIYILNSNKVVCTYLKISYDMCICIFSCSMIHIVCFICFRILIYVGQGKRKIRWAQAIYPLRARLQELKNNVLSEKWDEVLEDESMELKSREQASMATRPKLIQAGYTTLDSIPRIQKGSGTRFYCPALKGVDSRTQEKVSKWIQLLHKHPAHLHALDIKDA